MEDIKKIQEFFSKPLEEMMSIDDQAKAYFLEKFKKGEIDSLPDNPKAAFLDQMTKDEMEKDAAQFRSERGLEEINLSEAYVPENIKEFAKRKGVSRLVNTVAGWAEKVGARITGGTAIGKNYNTLILDMGYQTADIRIDCEGEAVELYDEPVYSFADFKRVFMEEETRKQIEHDEETLRREQGLEEKSLNEKMLVPTDKIDRMARDIAAKYFKTKTDKADAIEILRKAVEDSYRALDPEVEIKEEEGYSKFLKDDPDYPGGKTPGLTSDVMDRILQKIMKDVDEAKRPGLWDNIRAQKERGEKPARKGSKEYKAAVAAGKRINKEK